MTSIRPELHRAPASTGITGAAARRFSPIAAAVAAALGVAFAPHALAQQSTAAQLQTMKDQIEQLQRQIEQLQRQHAQPAVQTQPAAPAAAPAAAKTSATPAPTLKAGPVTLTFGGYTAFEGVYRNKNQAADIGSNYNAGIAYPYQTNDHIDETRFSARQSRFSLLAQGPVYGGMSGEAYLETDFLSAGVSSNSAESNSYTLRMRNFFGVLRSTEAQWYLLAGQSWSLATLYGNVQLAPRGERIPQTIDAQYVAGFNWTRNAQLRFVKLFGKTASFGISVESPEASFYTGCSGVATPAPAACGSVSALVTNTGGSLLNSTTNYSIDFAPDIIAKLAVDPGYGHYELYGLARGFRDRSPATTRLPVERARRLGERPLRLGTATGCDRQVRWHSGRDPRVAGPGRLPVQAEPAVDVLPVRWRGTGEPRGIQRGCQWLRLWQLRLQQQRLRPDHRLGGDLHRQHPGGRHGGRGHLVEVLPGRHRQLPARPAVQLPGAQGIQRRGRRSQREHQHGIRVVPLVPVPEVTHDEGCRSAPPRGGAG
jgi:type II secretory pathway pseudopilin PulG